MNQPPDSESPLPIAKAVTPFALPYAVAPAPSPWRRFLDGPIYPASALLTPQAAIFDAIVGLSSAGAAFVISFSAQVFDIFGHSSQWFVVTHVALMGGVTLFVITWLLWRRGLKPDDIGLQKTPFFPALGWAALSIPACYAANLALVVSYMAFVMLTQGVDPEQLIKQKMEMVSVIADTPSVMVIPATLLIGLYEELLFRGLLLTRLATLLKSPILAALISSLLFGGLHYMSQGLLGVLQTAAVGFVLSLLVIWRRNLWPAILAHCMMDAGAMFGSAILRDLLPA